MILFFYYLLPFLELVVSLLGWGEAKWVGGALYRDIMGHLKILLIFSKALKFLTQMKPLQCQMHSNLMKKDKICLQFYSFPLQPAAEE